MRPCVSQVEVEGSGGESLLSNESASLLLALAAGKGGESKVGSSGGDREGGHSARDAGLTPSSYHQLDGVSPGRQDVPSSETTEVPEWACDMNFCSDMLDGHQVSHILRNSDSLRKYALSTDRSSEQFATYDRHPAATALEPMSGVLYFVRITEGLQDKAISLKSVATGPSNFVWKMAWGRKTHLKSSGVLYKSYRCRYLYRPKNSPPPFRMQIYTLEEHDVEISKGDPPTAGLALIHILSVQDAPPRHWPTVRAAKRSAEALRNVGHDDEEQKRSPPTGKSADGVHLVPATPFPAPSTSCEGDTPHVALKAARIATNLEDVYSPARGRGSGGSSRGRGGKGAGSSATPGSARGGHQKVVAAQKEVVPPLQVVEHAQQQQQATVVAARGPHQIRIACDPMQGLEGGQGLNKSANGRVAAAVIEGARCVHRMSAESFPVQAAALKGEFGGLSGEVLGGLVTGTPWGIPGGVSCGGGGLAPDFTAMAWGKLIALCELQQLWFEMGSARRQGVQAAGGGL